MSGLLAWCRGPEKISPVSDRIRHAAARHSRPTQSALRLFGIAAALIAVSACGENGASPAHPSTTATTRPTLTRDLAEMLFVEPDGRFLGDGSSGLRDLPRVSGTGELMFDGSCAYLHSLTLRRGDNAISRWPTRDAQSVSANLVFQFGEEMDRHPDVSGPIYLLRLGYNLTRYDPSARALWVNEVGPLTEGDRVAFDGFYGRRSLPTLWCPLVASGRIGTATLIPPTP